MDCLRWMLSLLMSAVFQGVVSVESVERNKWQGVPCSGVLDELIRHRNIVACRATWEGDIATEATDVCREGWEVCNWEYRHTLAKISWYEATHISGCYAINASHGDGKCSSCSGKPAGAEMAAIGADCLAYQKSAASCFGEGRIYASASLVPQYTPCHHAPWITGLLCCRKGSQYPDVKVIVKITPSTAVMVGTSVTLQCQVTGTNSTQYVWYKDSHHIESLDNRAVVQMNSVSSGDSGFWKCQAIYGHGRTVSHPIYFRVVEWSTDVGANGCKNKSRGRLLASANGRISLCHGAWNGHVRMASAELCAKGWKVCSNKNRPSLYSVLWQEVMNIEGCYAYNAASTKYYPCTRCSHRNKANRMAGIGSDCVNLQYSGYSCLAKGRIDVHNVGGLSPGEKRLRSCRHSEGITSGVACCKKTKKRKEQVRCKCKNGGKCSRRGDCKCRTNFRGERCRKRILRMQRKSEA